MPCAIGAPYQDGKRLPCSFGSWPSAVDVSIGLRSLTACCLTSASISLIYATMLASDTAPSRRRQYRPCPRSSPFCLVVCSCFAPVGQRGDVVVHKFDVSDASPPMTERGTASRQYFSPPLHAASADCGAPSTRASMHASIAPCPSCYAR